MIDPAASILAVFFIGLYVGLLRICYGTTTQLMAVSLLAIFGLPPVYAAGTNIAGNFCQAVPALFKKDFLYYAHRRLGLSLGLFGIIGLLLGHSLLTNLANMNRHIFPISCTLLLLGAGIAILIYSLKKKKNGGAAKNLPSYCCPFPGWHGPGNTQFIEFLSLPAVFLAGFCLGFGTGFWGLGPGLLGIILLSKIFNAPPAVTVGTDLIASSIIGTAALLSYFFAGHLNIFASLLFVTGTLAGNWVGNLAPPEIKAGMFRPAFGGLLLLGAAALTLKMAGYAKMSALLYMGGMILLCAALVAGHFLMTLWSAHSFKKEVQDNRSEHSPIHS